VWLLPLAKSKGKTKTLPLIARMSADWTSVAVGSWLKRTQLQQANGNQKPRAKSQKPEAYRGSTLDRAEIVEGTMNGLSETSGISSHRNFCGALVFHRIFKPATLRTRKII
jgi:hypothetical protein